MGIFNGGAVVSLILLMLGEGMGGFILTACYYNTMLLILFLTASLVLVTRVRSVKPPLEREELRLLPPLIGVVFYSSRNIRPWVFARSFAYLSRSSCLKESEESLERKSGDFRVLRVAWMVSWISLLLELKR